MGYGEVDPFTTDDLAGLISTATSSLRDSCIIYRYSQGARDDHGKLIEVWTEDDHETACGFGPPNRSEQNSDTGQIQKADAVLRLAAAETLTSYDRIQIVKKMGRAIDPEMYNVLGSPSAGPSAINVKLTRAT